MRFPKREVRKFGTSVEDASSAHIGNSGHVYQCQIERREFGESGNGVWSDVKAFERRGAK